MRITISLFILGIIFFLSSCKSPYFTSANNMRYINGVVKLKDGNEVSGPISSSLADYYSTNAYITVTPNNSKEQRVSVTQIRGISVRNNYYEPKLVDMGFGSHDQLLFLKKFTKEASRMDLYELYEQRTNNSRNGTYYTDVYSYYINAPGKTNEVWNLEGKHLTPNFEDKMSEMVKDCPSLAQKISSKEKGYFYAQVSLVTEKRIETMMNIIDEYNKCGK
ncbi:MAG: hypothetical protein ABIO04_02305 [Ferruginibacter sp.]